MSFHRALGLAACGLAFLVSVACTQKPAATPPEQPTRSAVPSPPQQAKDVSAIAREGLKSVVSIAVFDAAGTPLKDGSGFIISRDGKLVTNYHVIEGASSALVKFGDGGIYAVDGVIGASPGVDIAVLKVKAASDKEFSYLRLGNSDSVNIGERVIAIGTPQELEGTVSDGIISGRRDVKDLPQVGLLGINPQTSIFQITAPISPGSSGGPLLNGAGEVIGVTFLSAREGQNLNFAVPIRYVSPLASASDVKPFSAATKTAAVNAGKPITRVPHRSSGSAGSLPNLAQLRGTYTGAWQSSMFNASGAAVMTVSTQGTVVSAEIALTGGSLTKQTLTGTATRVGGGWSVALKTDGGDLYAKGIFKNGTFVGDYDYIPAADRGQWVVKKD
jgi:S1-C subfamily serine protease